VLDDFWEKWLGTLETDAFRKSSLVITAQETRLSTVDLRISVDLALRVRLFHKALVLSECGYNSSALLVKANKRGDHLHIGPISRGWTPSPRPSYRRYKRISADELNRAATMLPSLELIYARAPGPEYRRLRKGFNSWIQGVQSPDVGERLHFFVRSVEAILRPTTTTKLKK
jgi:hypothetical protein